jgi:hypothetical protein
VAASAKVGFREFLAIEAKGDLLRGCVRAVTRKAFVCQDGSDIAIELNLRRQWQGKSEERN